MEYLLQLRLLLGITGEENDALLTLLISDTENLVMGYCRTDFVPEQLKSLVPIIAADMYRRNGYGSTAAPQTVKSVSEGDRSVTYESDTDYDYLAKYYSRLAPFANRKGRVPSDLG